MRWLYCVAATLTLSVIGQGEMGHRLIGAESASEPRSASHDMVLFLPGGPLHIRVLISEEGQSLKQIRESYIQRLVQTLDTDGDGEVSRDESTNHPLFVTSRRFRGIDLLNRFAQRNRSRVANSRCLLIGQRGSW